MSLAVIGAAGAPSGPTMCGPWSSIGRSMHRVVDTPVPGLLIVRPCPRQHCLLPCPCFLLRVGGPPALGLRGLDLGQAGGTHPPGGGQLLDLGYVDLRPAAARPAGHVLLQVVDLVVGRVATRLLGGRPGCRGSAGWT